MTTNSVATISGQTIDQAMHIVEHTMFDVVNSDVDVLRDASRHILEAGGKRIRPRILMLSYMATGGTDLEYAAPVAAALELVHTASVVHDDINDHGIMRRGRPSVNSIWGHTFALLTGDFLFTKVYELMAPYRDLNVLFSDATTALVEGETLQASAVKNGNLNREVYFDIIARKTAALFKTGAMLGAYLNNASEHTADILGQFGFNIGLAFQIVDDILDLTSSDKQLGKTSGIDLEQGKGLASVVDPMESVHEKLMQGNYIAEGQHKARMLVISAIEMLDILPASLYKNELVDTARLVIDRTS